MDDSNSPYAPPASSIERPDELPSPPIPASKWLRFANLIIDYIGYMIFGMTIGFGIALIWGHQGIQTLESVPDFIIGIPIVLGYYILFETSLGRTPGKLVTGTRVVNEHGGRARFSQIIGRSVARFIPFEAFSFLGSTGRGWHDSLAKTYVVKCR